MREMDPNRPPPHLLDALSRFSRKQPSPYIPRKLPDHEPDAIARDIARDQRRAMVKNEDPNLPPLRLLLALRRHGRNRPYVRRRLSRREAHCLPLSRLVEIGTPADIRGVLRTKYWFGLKDIRRPGPGRRTDYRHRQISAQWMLRRLRLVSAAERKEAHQSVQDIVEELRSDESERERRLAFARARSILRTVGPVVINRRVLARARRLAEDLTPDANVLVRRGLWERVLTPEHLRTGDVILDWSNPERRGE